MDVAQRFAQLSYARRLKVGCIIVKDDRIISIGYNGMPAGWDNDCEYVSIGRRESDVIEELVTKPEVLHAESNAIAKLARSSESGEGASLFVTHQPCMNCAKMIYQSGISTVIYKEPYRCEDGVQFLIKCGVEVVHYNANQTRS